MDEPSKKEEPKECSETELNDRGEQPSLNELAKARNEEAAHGGDHVSC